jgi:hypothetical protein
VKTEPKGITGTATNGVACVTNAKTIGQIHEGLVRHAPQFREKNEIIAHTECLARSLKHWTGRVLMSGVFDPLALSRRVFEAPFVLVSHGSEADPILNYGNRSALTLWDISWDELTRMPSRLTAEAANREERARLLEG